MMSNSGDNLTIDEFDLDNLDFDVILGDLVDTSVVGGFDGETDDGCESGACKI